MGFWLGFIVSADSSLWFSFRVYNVSMWSETSLLGTCRHGKMAEAESKNLFGARQGWGYLVGSVFMGRHHSWLQRVSRWNDGRIAAGFVGVWVLLCAGTVWAQDLVVNGVTQTLGGVHHYDTVRVINGGRIVVPAFDGSDRVNTGNLQIVANSILVDSSSEIVADGAGYQPVLCGDGAGPTLDAGGRGGCSVRDSGGGGAHFGKGGRGTKDCFVYGDPNTCQFPQEWEEDCGDLVNGSCSGVSNCRNNDGLPSVAGVGYRHSIYDIEFGAAGGDKGCLDSWDSCSVGGAGGGRIVLAAVNASQTGSLRIEGRVSADGWRGCGHGNDSAGGGAGGSILLVGDDVVIAQSAHVSAAGGLGGDTRGAPECPPCAQSGGTCDDCGGGGGGGIVSVLSRRPAQIESLAVFDVAGSLGGTCPICNGEAGGGAGELQLDGIYVGEYCDGYDNDFDGETDEDLGTVSCGTGPCQVTVPSCQANEPADCVPNSVASCQEQVGDDTRPRFLVILDTSSSMLTDLDGVPTFGDGSAGHIGFDTNGDGVEGNDSRLYKAKSALGQVISAYPEIDYALARFTQHQGSDVSCMLAHWVECTEACCTYDDPRNNQGTASCSLTLGAAGTVSVPPDSPTGDQCINYVGWCGPPRRGADILVGFQSEPNHLLMWMDNHEDNFLDDRTEGNFCRYDLGGDCELRGSGPTPLAGALGSAKAYLAKTIALDPIADCRTYNVILLTDGAETCLGDPESAASELLADLGVHTYVIGFSVLPEEQASLNGIAAAGGTNSAFFVSDEDELGAALASLVASSIVFEQCNGLDDDCDGQIDEDFPLLGQACDDGGIGQCKGTGSYQCSLDGTGVECVIDQPGQPPEEEVCNGKDDDCDGQIDEGLDCTSVCEPDPPEVCNGRDDDCDGAVDEEDPMLDQPCGQTQGQVEGWGLCEPGHYVCAGGELVCVGGVGPSEEICNGLDDDCDGQTDEQAECPGESVCIEGNCRRPCSDGEFPCPGGFECKEYEIEGETGRYCVPSPCMDCGPNEACIDDECVDLCEGVECEEGEECVYGVCRDCNTLGCPQGQVCYDSHCIDDPCSGVDCDAQAEYCDNGTCKPLCYDEACPEGMTCNDQGDCEPDPCATLECGPDMVCQDGRCRDDPCRDIHCALGQVCVLPGQCEEDPCILTSCPSNAHCVTERDGRSHCVPNGAVSRPPEPTEVLMSGGGGMGCTCGTERGRRGAGFPASWFFMLLVAAAILRRKS